MLYLCHEAKSGWLGRLAARSQSVKSDWPSEQSTHARKFVTCPAQPSPVQAISQLDEISTGMETKRDCTTPGAEAEMQSV